METQKVPFSCPVCGRPLGDAPGGLACPAGHRFDRAAKGYVNLLPAGRLPSSHAAGDAKELLRARREFLDAGPYAPLADALRDMLRECVRPDGSAVFADLGCGEGYYTARVARAFPGADAIGLDISKDAVAMACARSVAVRWAVANSFRPPLPDACADAALCVFAPFAAEALARVLRPGGFALAVLPGARHLFELKRILYDRPYENDETPPPGGALTATAVTRLRYPMRLSHEALSALFCMTPYARRTGPDGLARLRACGECEVTADFLIVRYEKA